MSLKGGYPRGSVFVKPEKVNLDYWGSILSRLFMSVFLSLRRDIAEKSEYVHLAVTRWI